ncbi:MAG TPA: radical SAM protein [Candidatus Gastranaerophilales bacterium]|nr:radical SAM protein [Candidatus Gastranaerophilales bacterium]
MKIYLKDNLCTIYKLTFNRIQQFFVQNGHEIVNSPNECDVIVIGTCAAFEADEDRSVNLLKSVQGINAPVYVYGCLTQVSPHKIPYKNTFASWRAKALVEKIVTDPKVGWDDITLPSEFRVKEDYRIYNPKKRFVGILTGCAFNCTYCPHKIGAGSIESRPEKEIVEQINSISKENPEIIILTGIDTASYGKDIGSSFSNLLSKVLENTTSIKFCIAQFNPEGLKDNYNELIRYFQDLRIIDIQIPIQTTSPRLLKLMNRNYLLSDVEKAINLIKEKNPKVLMRTDLMVGFPTETMAELDASIEFVVNNFDEVAVYGYEYKKNTMISSFPIDFYDENEIKKRVEYAYNKLKQSSILVHSGGQEVLSLLEVDKQKEKLKIN